MDDGQSSVLSPSDVCVSVAQGSCGVALVQLIQLAEFAFFCLFLL